MSQCTQKPAVTTGAPVAAKCAYLGDDACVVALVDVLLAVTAGGAVPRGEQDGRGPARACVALGPQFTVDMMATTTIGNLGEDCPRPSAYVLSSAAGSARAGWERHGVYGAGDLDDVRLVAAIGTGLQEPPDPVIGFWTREPPGQPDLPGMRSSPYAGPIDVFGPPTAMARPAAAAQRAHECGADGHLAGALREMPG